MVLVYLLIAFAVGLLVPLQAAVNNALRQQLGSGALLAALISFAVGTATLLGVALVTGQPFQTLGGLGRIPVWQWLGGILGAFFVFGSTLVAPRIGLAAMVSLIVAGQAASALAFDRVGLAGLPLRPWSWPRLAGMVLILAGAALVNGGDRLFGRS